MAESYIKRSGVTGKKYDYFSKDYVRIVNIDQATMYLKNEVELIDIYTSHDKTTGKNILVFVFDKASSKPYFDLWCKGELK